MNGIDVSYAQGAADLAGAAAEGCEFVMIKASQGRLLADRDSGPFADPCFARNIRAAADAGLFVGVYHYLCAETEEEALAEADFFLSVIAPYRQLITLWAVCDAEEDRYLPRDKETLGRIVDAFLGRVSAAGFRPMLYSNPNYLTYRLPDMRRYDLWLAFWGATEARALAYNPKIWQYGTDSIGTMKQVDVNRGYFTLDEKNSSLFEDASGSDDAVLVSGSDTRGDGGSVCRPAGGLRRPRRRPIVYRRPHEWWRRFLHDQIRRRKQGADPADGAGERR